ncbi:MAG: TIGR04086 family membrane protein [Lachnospiraceae bacterium]|nr:TIGR04086 family membrane protein [Lachnospiraceae bacterium]
MEFLQGRGKIIVGTVTSLMAAFLTTVILLLAFAFLLLKLQLDVGKTEIGILLIYVLSCFIGGIYRGKRAARRKFLWGMLTGILYFLLLLIVSGMGEEALQPELTRTITAFVLCTAGGTLGGMLA